MSTILVVGEVAADGTVTKLSTEIATAARSLGEARGIVPGATADTAAQGLAEYLPSVEVERGAADDRAPRRSPPSWPEPSTAPMSSSCPRARADATWPGCCPP